MKERLRCTSDIIKRALYREAVYRSCLLAMAEVPFWYGQSDFVMVSKSRLWTDFEIKVSIADLKAEKKKKRHLHWGDQYWDGQNVPNYYCFVLDESICEEGLSIISQEWPFAGVMKACPQVKTHPIKPPSITHAKLVSLKNCKRIHKVPMNELTMLRHYRNLNYRYGHIMIDYDNMESGT